MHVTDNPQVLVPTSKEKGFIINKDDDENNNNNNNKTLTLFQIRKRSCYLQRIQQQKVFQCHLCSLECAAFSFLFCRKGLYSGHMCHQSYFLYFVQAEKTPFHQIHHSHHRQ